MTKLKGDAFHEKLVTEDEVDKKLEEVKSGMMMAYNYAQGIYIYCLMVHSLIGEPHYTTMNDKIRIWFSLVTWFSWL